MEIHKGSAETIYFRNYVSGVLTSTAGSVTLSLLDSDGIELAAPSVTTVSTGTYSATVTSAVASEERDITALWSYDSTTREDVYTVVTPYLDAYSIMSLAPSGTSWDDAKYAEQYARNKINAATGQSFGKSNKSVVALGRGTDVLLLPERVISYTHLYKNTELVIDVDGDVNDFGYDVRVSETNMALLIDSAYDIKEFRQTGTTYRGAAFIEGDSFKVTGLFGWNKVPDEISSATKELMEDYWCNDNKWRESYVISMKNGDWTVEFDPGVFVSTGNFYVDAMVQDYVVSNMVIL